MKRLLVLLCVLLCACSGPVPEIEPVTKPLSQSQEELVYSLSPAAALGGLVYFGQDFQGDRGITCGDCHLLGTTITPQQVQITRLLLPGHPLFDPIDADTGASTYNTLLRDATFNVVITLAANVSIDNPDPLRAWQAPDGRWQIKLRRGVPTSFNTGLNELLLHDGRAGNNLGDQAQGAVNDHFGSHARPVTPAEKSVLTSFQQGLFTNTALRDYFFNGPPPELPHGVTALEKEGEKEFRNVPPTEGGLCAMCHSGPMLNQVNEFTPTKFLGTEVGIRTTGNGSSEENLNGYPTFTYRFHMPSGPDFVVTSPDIGVAAVTGNPCPDAAGCTINSIPDLGIFSTASTFVVPTLWGAADTAPWMHDNSVRNIDELLAFYKVLFNERTVPGLHALEAQGLPVEFLLGYPIDSLLITPQREAAIKAYFNRAFH